MLLLPAPWDGENTEQILFFKGNSNSGFSFSIVGEGYLQFAAFVTVIVDAFEVLDSLLFLSCVCIIFALCTKPITVISVTNSDTVSITIKNKINTI